MNRTAPARRALALASLAVALAAAPDAGATLIDFEAYADFDNLHGQNLGGVTLTAPNGVVEIFANNRQAASFHSPVNAIASLIYQDDQWGDAGDTLPVTGVFDEPQNFIRLWGGDSGGPDNDSWELEAFNAQDQSIGLAQSGLWDGSPYSMLQIAAPGIVRFEARWTGPDFGMSFDDLEFTPAPGSAAPLVATLLLARRRRSAAA